MIRANGHAAVILAIGLLTGIATASHAEDDLKTPVFVTAPDSGTQANTTDAQPAAESQAPANGGLTDSDRSARDNAAAQPSAAPATADASAARDAPAVAGSGEHSVWDETSLIGKIFIGFGALLTVASAARMFMA